MKGQRKAAIAVATTGTGLFVLAWLGLSGAVPVFTTSPIDALTGPRAPSQPVATAPDNAGDVPGAEDLPPTPATESRPAPSAPRWQFGDDDHEREHHGREHHDDDDEDDS